MISVGGNSNSIAKKALDEAVSLVTKNIVNDEFIRSAISDLKTLSSSHEISEDVYARVSSLGVASVRGYQSFDEIPETDTFVELFNHLSKVIPG